MCNRRVKVIYCKALSAAGNMSSAQRYEKHNKAQNKQKRRSANDAVPLVLVTGNDNRMEVPGK